MNYNNDDKCLKYDAAAPTQSLGSVLEQQTAKYLHKSFLFWNDEEVSYLEFNARVNRVANALLSVGVKSGDMVGLLSPNCPEFLYTFFACFKIGCVVVPVNALLKAEEIQYALENSGCVVLIATHGFASAIDSIRHQLPLLRHIWYIGDDSNIESRRKDISLSDVMLRSPSHNPRLPIDPSQIASIIYTSGTTGKPKGVMLTHSNYYHNSGQTAYHFKVTENDRLLCFLPLFHVNAQIVSLLCSLRVGASFVLMPKFSPAHMLPAIAKYKVTSFSAVPAIYSILNSLPDYDQYDLSSLRFCICGAAPMPIEVIHEFERKYKAYIVELYGLSETSCVSTINPLHLRKVGSIGKAAPGLLVKIVDEKGNTLSPGVIGEIVIYGPTVMSRYHNNEVATKATIKDGWLYTGDYGCVDQDGYFFITGRKKEMIIRGGENIYPKEIEEILYKHPSVLDCAVIGIPHRIYGEEVAVAFVLRKGQKFVSEEVFEYCKKHLADYKCPKSVKYFEQFPKTATGKIQKNKLVEMYMSSKL
eukprot:TRINITY_DN2243_c0_g1_i1.p1 TRINITY_DN2243_c0_g1~~TRINITY_DN2243_c0_g1_i1.p1  ORF type:complete len:529 (+),score=129.98 TRINITY_DN2243_c0_g1_i1:120-1706(+)